MLCDPIDPKALSFGNGLLAQFRWTRISSPMPAVKAPRSRNESGIQYYEQLAYDPSPLLQDISAPTFILRGEEDAIAEEHQAIMQAGIAGAEFTPSPAMAKPSIGKTLKRLPA